MPAPAVQPGQVLIANEASVVSVGTERMVRELAKRSLVGKALERPDQVRKVLEKLRADGLRETLRAVDEKLDEPMRLGYASAGRVIACGRGVQEYQPGDRVASNGPHAGVVSVPKHLCARVPDGVAIEHAAFAVLGAIALHGVRLSEAALGETVFVVGLGLVGQLAVGLLKAAGCRVVATDPDAERCRLARERMGADHAEPGLGARELGALTGDVGADAVVIAAATSSNDPIELAVAAVRKRGRIVLVGVVGLELDRRALFHKECTFVVSCSYGPGRYDSGYEEHGRDYPVAYVRWTEQRNLQAVLDLMAAGRLDVGPLISHEFSIGEAERAYALIERAAEPFLGVVLRYDPTSPAASAASPPAQPRATRLEQVGVGCLGAGAFARTVLLPLVRRSPHARLTSVCSAGGLSAAHAADRLGFEAVAPDEDAVVGDPRVQAVFVLTRHDRHARQVVKAIEAGKHVFVEKPLALSADEVAEIEGALRARGPSAPIVMVGFNRRFSPLAERVRRHFAGFPGPLTVSVRFNAGALPAEHWTQDDDVGGGRIVGEACHGIDLATFLVGSPPVRVFAEAVGGARAPTVRDDQAFLTLRHADGSVSSVAYLSGGSTAFPKERVEVLGGGRVAVIDDFRSLTLVDPSGKTSRSRSRRDKGHRAEVEAFLAALRHGGAAPIPWEQVRAVSLASVLAVQSLREGLPLELS